MRFIVEINPIPQKRPRAAMVNRHVVMYDAKDCKDYKAILGAHYTVQMDGLPPMSGALKVDAEFILPVSMSWTKKKKAAALAGEIIPEKSRGDIDNLMKAAFDAGNGIIWNDDSQIVEVVAKKRYGEVPGVLMDVVNV